MTWGAITGLTDPMEDFPGWWMIAFAQGTTNRISMATDETGGTTAAELEISSGGVVPIGFLKTAGDAITQPWVEEAYDLFIVPTQAEAIAGTTTNGNQIADNGIPAEVSGATANASLRSDLANNTDAAKGSDLIGHLLAGLTGVSDFSWFVNDAINGLYNRLVYITDKRFGAVGDGVTDDTAAINAAATYLGTVGAEGGGLLIMPVPDVAWLVSSTIFIPWNVNVDGTGGNSSVFKVAAGFAGTNNYVFSLNSSDASGWDIGPIGMATGSLKRIDIDNSAGPTNTRGIFMAGSWLIEEIKQNELANHVTTSGDYGDHQEIRRAHSRLSPGTDYLYEFNILGDGVKVDGISVGSGPNLNAVKVVGCLAGEVSRVIGGTILFDRCGSMVINNFHTETGGVISQDSNTIIRDSWIKSDYDNIVPIDIVSLLDDRNHVSVENTSFVYYLDATPSGFTEDDIRMSSSTTTLSVINCHKRTFKSGEYSIAEQSGIRVVDASGVGIDDFNNHSYLNSLDGFIEVNNKVKTPKQPVDVGSGNISLISGANTLISNKVVWNEASATYFYQVMYLYDPVRLIGRGNSAAERSFALTNGGDGVRLQVQTSAARSTSTICRVFRGTSTGSYNAFVDIPLVSQRYIYDRGTNISGYLWKSRGAAGVDSIDDLQGLRWDQGLLTATGDVPIAGNYIHGDKTYDPTPSAAGTIGSTCTEGGTFGTLNSGATTGGITTGTPDLVVNDAAELLIGQSITVVGVTGTFVIIDLVGTAVTLDDNADATVAGAAVAFFNPTFKTFGAITA